MDKKRNTTNSLIHIHTQIKNNNEYDWLMFLFKTPVQVELMTSVDMNRLLSFLSINTPIQEVSQVPIQGQ